jgi:hypothetical protein
MYFTNDRKLGSPLVFSAKTLSEALQGKLSPGSHAVERDAADDLIEFLEDQVDRRERIADAAGALERRRRESSC